MTGAAKGEGQMTGSFAGLRVLDFSTTIAGPHCTRMLADLGAEVIKIETDEGETMRTRLPVRNGCSTTFGQLNIGKNSVVLDLKSAQGVEAVRRLVATSDVLVENFRPGVMSRLKLDYDSSIRALNPKLIYCSISGYGQSGPSAELPAYAPVIHAASGYEMAHLAYQPGRIAAGLLRHLSCRRADRRLWLRRDRRPLSISARRPARASISTSRCWKRC